MGCGYGGEALVSFFLRVISMVESQSTRCWASAMDVSWGRGYQSSVLRSGSALLASLWTGFGAVAPGDVRR